MDGLVSSPVCFFSFSFFFFFLKGREGDEFVRDILKLVDYLLTQADKP